MRHFLTIFLFLLSAECIAGDLDTKKIIIISGDDYCPLSCNPISGKNGLGYDLAKHIYSQLGWQVQYEFVPFQRAIAYFKEGRVDLIPGVAKDNNTDFIDALLSNIPIVEPRMCFYTRSDDPWTFQGLTSLNKGRLGAIAGYYYWPELKEYIARHKNDGKVDIIASENAVELSLHKLIKGRFDYFVELRPAVEYHLMRKSIKPHIREANCLMKFPLYMAFRKDFKGAKELNAHWDKSLVPFLKSPEGAQLLKNYGLSFKSIMD